MKPLQITWTFGRPLISTDIPIHLDSLLAWALVEEAKESDHPDPFSVISDLPLNKTKQNIWKASILVFEPALEINNSPMTKPFDLKMLAGDQGVYYHGKINGFKAGTGKYKGFDLRIQHQWQFSARAWCVGDQKRVEQLLKRVLNIGKLTRNNFGLITDTQIEVNEKAKEYWKVRHLPLPLEEKVLPGYARAMRVCRPPYWDKTTFEPCQVPIEPDLLCAVQ